MLPLPVFTKMAGVVRKHGTPGPHGAPEIELRLGKRTTKMFDTNIGHDAFTRIVRGLEKYTQWDSVTTSDESVYYKDGSDGYRIIINNDTDEAVYQVKKKMEVLDTQLDGPLDLRLAVSYEEPCENRECEMDREVRRVRKSFLRKGVRIDCTEVTGTPSDRDSESDVEYQVELELVGEDFAKSSDVELYNSMHKAMNVISLVRGN